MTGMERDKLEQARITTKAVTVAIGDVADYLGYWPEDRDVFMFTCGQRLDQIILDRIGKPVTRTIIARQIVAAADAATALVNADYDSPDEADVLSFMNKRLGEVKAEAGMIRHEGEAT